MKSLVSNSLNYIEKYQRLIVSMKHLRRNMIFQYLKWISFPEIIEFQKFSNFL